MEALEKLENARGPSSNSLDPKSAKQIIELYLSQVPAAGNPDVDWRSREDTTVDDNAVRTMEDLRDKQGCIDADLNASMIDTMMSTGETLCEILEAESYFNDETSCYFRVYERYSNCLDALCVQTGTSQLQKFVQETLPEFVEAFQSLTIDFARSVASILDVYAHCLVTCIWLAVCRKYLIGGAYRRKCLLETMGTLFEAAKSVLQSRKVDRSQQQVSFSIEYREKRDEATYIGRTWWGRFYGRPITLPYACPFNRGESDITAKTNMHALKTKGKAMLLIRMIEEDVTHSRRRTIVDEIIERDEESREWIVGECCELFAAINGELLSSLIEGSFSRKAANPSTEISQVLGRMRGKDPEPPSIYLNALCDFCGVSPTASQWARVCECMLTYIANNEEAENLAAEIDQILHPKRTWPRDLAHRHLRRYSDFGSGNSTTFASPKTRENRRSIINEFAQRMLGRTRAQITAGKANSPLDSPVINIGFSIHAGRRLEDHRLHRGSNYLMNLSEACFCYCYGNHFGLQQRVIFNCYRHPHPWLAKIVFTHLAQGYTEDACGFSHYTAGASNSGGSRVRTTRQWEDFRLQAEQGGRLVHARNRFFPQVRKLREEMERDKALNKKSLHLQALFWEEMSDVLDLLTEQARIQ